MDNYSVSNHQEANQLSQSRKSIDILARDAMESSLNEIDTLVSTLEIYKSNQYPNYDEIIDIDDESDHRNWVEKLKKIIDIANRAVTSDFRINSNGPLQKLMIKSNKKTQEIESMELKIEELK